MIYGRNVHHNLLGNDLHSLYVFNFRSNITYSRGRYTATRSSSKNVLVSAAITILYLSLTVGAGCQWYITKWQFVDNGDTRDSVFLSFNTAPQWSVLVFNISLYVSFVTADGILVRVSINSFLHNLHLQWYILNIDMAMLQCMESFIADRIGVITSYYRRDR
jgi:hypothetical protein